MVYHILNGDSLACTFPETGIQGETIIVREAFIEGDLSGDTLRELWQTRSRYAGLAENEYRNRVAIEFEKILKAPEDATFNLWFEYDLFCQVNMWFVIYLINHLAVKKKVFAVYSSYLDIGDKCFWNGFGPASVNELRISFDNKILLTDADLQFGRDLWEAYKNNNLELLDRLSKKHANSFPYLEEVIKAHIERFPVQGEKGRPEKVIEDIMKNISTDFNRVFKEFYKRESIYGFGDVQLKHIYDKVMNDQ
jgi:hypothetical protein